MSKQTLRAQTNRTGESGTSGQTSERRLSTEFEGFPIGADETAEEILSLRRCSTREVRRALEVRSHGERHVTLAGYAPERSYHVLRFGTAVRLGGTTVPPGSFVTFDERGPVGSFTHEEFERYTKAC